MKSTTFPPMKVGKNQVLRPSGVKESKDGKYKYWQCSVSGQPTFAKPDYWVKIMAKYGSEAKLVKTYVCKKAKTLLDEGKTQAEIIDILSKPVTKEAKKEKVVAKQVKAERKKLLKGKRRKGLKSSAVGTTEVSGTNSTGSVEVKAVPVYPWQSDPNYFRSEPNAISIAEMTKDACAFPARNIDDECRECPFYSECTCGSKFSESDWKKPRSKKETKVTQLKSFDE